MSGGILTLVTARNSPMGNTSRKTVFTKVLESPSVVGMTRLMFDANEVSYTAANNEQKYGWDLSVLAPYRTH